ncbi:hypothetical protein XENORESO_012203 [Xenotaenia resolanae]|uniref:Uncharacterized protein n=1 Tax=Xenotaenia resolanae TaxID=208358 RepID=A0ABV0WL56_9TELE
MLFSYLKDEEVLFVIPCRNDLPLNHKYCTADVSPPHTSKPLHSSMTKDDCCLLMYLTCCYGSSLQHSLTCTADLVLERLSQKVSALAASSELQPDEAADNEDSDAPAQIQEGDQTPTC